MKFIVFAACLVAASLAAPTIETELSPLRLLPALEHEEIHDERGQYTLHYLTAEGTEVTEEGRLVPTPDGQAFVLAIRGETKYIGTDGKMYVTKYTAGLDGVHIEGDHLPVPVVAEPVPEPVAPEVPQ